MSESIKLCMNDTKEQMQKTLTHLDSELQKIRAGKATPQMLDSVRVDSYGAMMALSQVANVTTPDPKSIVIQPWDKSLLRAIEKAIIASNLGFNPANDGELIRILVPPLTEERRKDLTKKVKAEIEQAKIVIRNIRRSANELSKQLQKDGEPEDAIKRLEKDIQDMTNDFINKVDKIAEAKEKEIMTV